MAVQREDEASAYDNGSTSQREFASTTNDEHPNFSANVKRKENPAACIFVASLNKNVPDDELTASVFDHFKQWGNLLGVKVLKDWLKRPYAFVQYEFEQDAKFALQEAVGTYVNGRSIRCEPARVNRSICLITFNRPFNKQFLHSQLSTFGEIEDITILQPNGKFHYVFIKFKYRDDAIRSYLTLKGADNSSGHSWFVEWASNLDVNNMYGGIYGTSFVNRCLDKISIFVGNLHDSITDDEVKEVFSQYGSIVNIHVLRKPYHHQRKRVFAFIKYQTECEAARAIDHENGRSWNDKVIRVCYREYSHNANAYVPSCSNNSSCYYGYGNNKQTSCYPMMEQQRNRSSRQQQQIMTPFMEEGSIFYTPYYNSSVSPTTSKSTLFDNLSANSGGSAGPSSTENLFFNNNNNSKVNKSQGIIAAGTFYPVNVEDNGLYNTPPYFIADPYTSSGGATGMVYYPYPVQPYYYNSGNRTNYRRKKY